jgi:hypothetical protein
MGLSWSHQNGKTTQSTGSTDICNNVIRVMVVFGVDNHVIETGRHCGLEKP